MEKLKILFVASEVTPFAKTGGLADVSAAVPRFLKRDGHDVRVLMPFYRSVSHGPWTFTPHEGLLNLSVDLGGRTFPFQVGTAPLPGSDVQVMFLSCPELYDRDGIYTLDGDEHLRFALLSRAPMVICQWLQWAPDILHLNDWHTGLAPIYLRTAYSWDRLFERTKTVLTIHNVAYQGVFGEGIVDGIGLGWDRGFLHQEDLQRGVVNFLKTGLIYANVLTTVSETYAREIQMPELGMGLDDVLRARSDHLVGIVNGVDYAEWDPSVDRHLTRNYSAETLSVKEENKRALLEEFHLAPDPTAPVFGIVSRMTAQKGFELLPDVLPVLLREADARLVVLGSGDPNFEQYFQWLHDSIPDRVGIYRGYNEKLAHQIEAGADVFLMPSLFEPCGLNQMYSLRYGTAPLVRSTGGLADTVEEYDPVTGEGTGFVFYDYTPEALLGAMRRALHVYTDRSTWQRLMTNGMSRDFSWDHQGRKYVDLYRALLSG